MVAAHTLVVEHTGEVVGMHDAIVRRSGLPGFKIISWVLAILGVGMNILGVMINKLTSQHIFHNISHPISHSRNNRNNHNNRNNRSSNKLVVVEVLTAIVVDEVEEVVTEEDVVVTTTMEMAIKTLHSYAHPVKKQRQFTVITAGFVMLLTIEQTLAHTKMIQILYQL